MLVNPPETRTMAPRYEGMLAEAGMQCPSLTARGVLGVSVAAAACLLPRRCYLRHHCAAGPGGGSRHSERVIDSR